MGLQPIKITGAPPSKYLVLHPGASNLIATSSWKAGAVQHDFLVSERVNDNECLEFRSSLVSDT